MWRRLELDKQMATVDEILRAWQEATDPVVRRKMYLMFVLYRGADREISRKDLADAHCVSPRTLNRWIHKFNGFGLDGVLQARPKRPGPQRCLELSEFHGRILPELERAVQTAGNKMNIKALFRSAQSTGLFPRSYATFRRYLVARRSDYQRRPMLAPTIEDWLLFTRTGRWPARLRSLARRRAKQEQQAWQRFKDAGQGSISDQDRPAGDWEKKGANNIS